MLPLVAAGVALMLLLPWMVRWLGRPTTVRQRTVTPVWRAAAAFVRPGLAVRLPVPGQVRALTPPGLVPAHAVLARYQPFTGGKRSSWLVAPLWHLRAGVGGPRAETAPWRRSLRAVFCLRRRCVPAAAAAIPAAQRPTLRAARSGWFTPGWDPLALVPAAAYSDLPPQALRDAVQVVATSGQVVQAGAPIGMLGPSWSGVWMCDLPAGARGAVAAAGSARITWSGGAAQVHLLAEGPTVAGRFLASFATRSGGADPGPPQRTRVRVRLAAVRGVALPVAALRHGAVVALGPGGMRDVPVQVRLRMRQLALVRGLPSGTRVLLRPWVAAPWLAGLGTKGGK